MAFTAEAWNQPPIKLIDPDTGEKIKLRLRRMSFAREIASLPSDLLKLHEMMARYHSSQNENRYMVVSVWNKMRVFQRFWESFKFSTEAGYLAYYDLPDGATLAGWTIMVNLFDKATFMLLGDQVLSFMIHLVGRYQNDTDKRKKDYQAIFDRYCKINDSFDKTTFYRAVREHVEETYEKKEAEDNGMSQAEWRRKKETFRPGTRKRRFTKETLRQQKHDPHIEKDFDWKEEQCSSCVSKIKIIKEALRYIGKLEQLITEKVGPEAVPERPLALQGL